MKYLIALILLGQALVSCQNGTTDVAVEKNVEISVSKLKAHVDRLASDELEGRGAGYRGGKEAGKYIANVFKELKLTPYRQGDKNDEDYLQSFEFHTIGSPYPWEKLTAQNVVGFLPGENPDEYIVIGGHHDGQGMKGQAILGRDIAEGEATDSIAAAKDTIWNSAVDNAVSIATIMEIARVLKESNIKLTRSIIFATFSAEESGLDGSTYFVNNPVVPKRQIKGMINLEKLIGDPDAELLYVSYGTNRVFEEIRKSVDTTSDIKLVPFYPGMIANSDHYAFAQRKIPAVTIGTGSRINVHTQLDHSDSLDYALLKRRSQYVLDFLIRLVNSDTDLAFEGDMSGLLGVSGGPATKEEKMMKKFAGEVAFKVTTVVRDSKGHNSGLIPGDLIIAIDDEPIRYQEFYQGLEDVIGESDKESITLKIIRGDKVVTSTIALRD